MGLEIEKDCFRKNYIQLTKEQSDSIQQIKQVADCLEVIIKEFKNREMSLAITKLEECVMWAVKGVTSLSNIMRGAEVQVDLNPSRE